MTIGPPHTYLRMFLGNFELLCYIWSRWFGVLCLLAAAAAAAAASNMDHQQHTAINQPPYQFPTIFSSVHKCWPPVVTLAVGS